MTLRTRLLAASIVVVVIPLAVFGLGVRERVSSQVTRQYERRVSLMVSVIRREIDEQGHDVAARLEALAQRLAADNRFRQAVSQGGDPAGRAYVIDYADNAMPLSGLAMLQIQNPAGRIVSSGHFRNEFDLPDPALPKSLEQVGPGPAVVRARTAEGAFLSLVRLDSAVIAGRVYTLVGGTAFDVESASRFAASDDISVSLVLPGDTTLFADRVAGEIALPYVATTVGGEATVGEARLVVTRSSAPIVALERAIDAWFAAAIVISIIVAGSLALLLASRMARPITTLAEQTANLDLDRLDVSFATGRRDEVGQLQRFLDAMTARLRASVRTLKEVERRAAMGDLARQVNHDVKNGLTPIRNVLRHLTQVAEQDPAKVGAVFRERRATLESSVEYLERLAANYAGLYPRLDQASVDANDVVRAVAAHLDLPPTIRLKMSAAGRPFSVRTDRLALRRVVENLAGNAVDSMDGTGGVLTLGTETAGPVVRIIVRDTGPGMTREQLDRALGDFYTTKPEGTGLGFTIVRRLVTDMGGTFRVRTEPGVGTECVVELPAELDE